MLKRIAEIKEMQLTEEQIQTTLLDKILAELKSLKPASLSLKRQKYINKH